MDRPERQSPHLQPEGEVTGDKLAENFVAATSLLTGTLRWILVFLFFVSGVRKLLDIDWFGRVLWATGFFSAQTIPVLVWCVPLVEVLVALSLALRRLEFAGILMALFMSASFAGLHAYLHLNGIVVPCGCSGLREQLPTGTYHLAMTVVCGLMAAASVALCAASPRRRGLGADPTARG